MELSPGCCYINQRANSRHWESIVHFDDSAGDDTTEERKFPSAGRGRVRCIAHAHLCKGGIEYLKMDCACLKLRILNIIVKSF